MKRLQAKRCVSFQEAMLISMNSDRKQWSHGARKFIDKVYCVKGIYGIECHYCNKHIPVYFVTVDHVIPKSMGGTDSKNNLVPACEPCNFEKSSMSYGTFIELTQSEEWKKKSLTRNFYESKTNKSLY